MDKHRCMDMELDGWGRFSMTKYLKIISKVIRSQITKTWCMDMKFGGCVIFNFLKVIRGLWCMDMKLGWVGSTLDVEMLEIHFKVIRGYSRPSRYLSIGQLSCRNQVIAKVQ